MASRCGEREASTTKGSGRDGAAPLDEPVLTEEQLDLADRALGAVGAVHDVLLF